VSTYSASKAFLTMWLDSIRLDVEPLGLNVTVIAPGFVKTPMTEDLRPEAMPFLLESDDACDRMARAIVRKERRFAFPWQTSLAVNSAAALLPRGLLDSMLRKFMARAPREAKRPTEST
jgi:short-subunit dehydrogenase